MASTCGLSPGHVAPPVEEDSSFTPDLAPVVRDVLAALGRLDTQSVYPTPPPTDPEACRLDEDALQTLVGVRYSLEFLVRELGRLIAEPRRTVRMLRFANLSDFLKRADLPATFDEWQRVYRSDIAADADPTALLREASKLEFRLQATDPTAAACVAALADLVVGYSRLSKPSNWARSP